MFKEGDVVDVVYTGKEYTNGIPLGDLKLTMKNNPHIVTIAGGAWVALEGSGYYFGEQLIQLHIHTTGEPDWEI